MITSEQAFEYIRSLNLTRVDEIQQLTKDRLSGKDSTPVGSDYFLEPSEDLLIQLLRKDDLPDEIKTGILKGCIDLYAQSWGWLASPDYREKIADYKDVFTRLCRVVDAASPAELERHSYSILNLVLEKDEEPLSEVLGASVRACMGYEQTEQHIDTWEKVINFKDAAAYAFNMLLSINPLHLRIERYLRKLWRRQIEDDWPVDTSFLMRRAARMRAEQMRDFICQVLWRLEKETWWDKVDANLRERVWTRDWLNWFWEWNRSVISLREEKGEIVYPSPLKPRVKWIDYGIVGEFSYHDLKIRIPKTDLMGMEELYQVIKRRYERDAIDLTYFKAEELGLTKEEFEEIESV